MDFVPYAVPFFLLAIALEYVWGRSVGRDTYRLNDSINSLSLGTLSTAIKLLGLDLAGTVFSVVESRFAVFRLDASSVWTWIAALLAYDFCYYWFHRISHERSLLWAAHVVHHQSEEFNLSTALRQTSTGFLLGWVFYLPCFALGIPAKVFVTVASLHLIYQFWIHSRHIPKLGPLEWVLVTASNHRVHHAQNPGYVDTNYGGLLIIWDRLFGTFAEEREQDPCVYGILGPLRSWNPLWANVHIYAGMLHDLRHTRGWGSKLRVLLGRTGWRPEDVSLRYPREKSDLRSFTRFDPPVPTAARFYVGLHFLALSAFSLWLMAVAPELAPAPRAALLAYLALWLVTIGMMIERPLAGLRLEWLRLPLCLVVPVLSGGLPASYLMWAAYLAGSLALLFWMGKIVRAQLRSVEAAAVVCSSS